MDGNMTNIAMNAMRMMQQTHTMQQAIFQKASPIPLHSEADQVALLPPMPALTWPQTSAIMPATAPPLLQQPSLAATQQAGTPSTYENSPVIKEMATKEEDASCTIEAAEETGGTSEAPETPRGKRKTIEEMATIVQDAISKNEN